MKQVKRMAKTSAGIILYRRNLFDFEYLLVHPGGPFYKSKDVGVWSIPKGEFDDKSPFSAAIREFAEETGVHLEESEQSFIPLTPIKQNSGKIVIAYALELDIDPGKIVSNTFELEWPRNSGEYQWFPEIDKGEWLTLSKAKQKIIPSQYPLLEELSTLLLANS
jgi:predicted NUDIX family NTP pyrophosphohydrolase